MIRDKWQEAHDKASFYKSEQNTVFYWDKVAMSGDSGLADDGAIDVLIEYLLEQHLIDDKTTVLDVGCGDGNYTCRFAELCHHVTAMDYSKPMIEACQKKASKNNLENITYVCQDIEEFNNTKSFDCVLACLNPVTYQPKVFDKLQDMAKKFVVYFSMDTPIENAGDETVYQGCNSVRYAEEYLKEKCISYHKLPYVYNYKMPDGSVREIPFAYIIY